MLHIRSTFGSPRTTRLACCNIFAVMLVLSLPTQAIAGCNSGDVARSSLLSSVQCQADAQGASSTAVGKNAVAQGPRTTAVGHASGTDFAVGPDGATFLGYYAGRAGAGNFSIAIGAAGTNSAILAPTALGAYSIAIGSSNDSNNLGAKANGYRSIAIGQKSVSADFGTSVGFNTHTGFAATAVGTDATAASRGGSAFGRFAMASAQSSVALGEGTVALTARSVALGSGSVANVADTVSVGRPTARRRIVNVAPAAGNSDAATLGQVKQIATAAAETANADLQQEVAELRALVKQQQTALNHQQTTLTRQQQEIAALKSRQQTTALQEP